MNAVPNLEIICSRVVDSYKKVYGDDIEGIYLYGSYARGDFNEESDVDFAAIVKGNREDLQQKLHQVWKSTNKMDLEYDIVTSATIIPADEFERYKDFLAYYKNLQRDGKLIG